MFHLERDDTEAKSEWSGLCDKSSVHFRAPDTGRPIVDSVIRRAGQWRLRSHWRY
jgi:hypothetical protein